MSDADSDTHDAAKPQVAIVCNSLPPYRVHFHRRIVREMPEMVLWSVCTHEDGADRWAFDPPAEIRPVRFGEGESPDGLGLVGNALHEWRKGGRIVKFLKQKRIAAVVLSGYNDAGRVRVFRWCRQHGVPVMIWGDSNVMGDNARGLKRLVKRAALRPLVSRADAILVCGSLGQRYFERYGAARSRMFEVPTEPDYALIKNLTEADLQRTAERFGLDLSRRRLVFSGRLVATKRPDLLLSAFARILDERPEWDLLVVGEGVLRQELVASLSPAAARRVAWTGFVNDQAAVSAICRLGDVLVLPSDYEPWALVVNDAVAADMALVCSDRVGAAAELVVAGRNGFIFPAGDVDALTDVLRKVTAADAIDGYKAASAGVLAAWRTKADPIAGLRRALASVGVQT